MISYTLDRVAKEGPILVMVNKELVLALLNYGKPFEVHCNALDYAIGRVLMQKQHPIAFESKLNEAEQSHSTKVKLGV